MSDKFKELALFSAEKVDPHKTSPNPRVGCVIVQDDRVLSVGVHNNYGHNHAERQAVLVLEKTGFKDWNSAEIFVTLEPCDHFEGKNTPSCTELLISKGFKKVYVLQVDTHFCGKNIEKIKSAGILVEVGFPSLLADRLESLNPFFDDFIKYKKPYVTLKIAQSLNGKITAKNETGRFTSALSLMKVHEMRARYSCILTSTETVLSDNPSFTTRLDSAVFPREFSQAVVVVLGKRKIPRDFKIFNIASDYLYFFDDLEAFIVSDLYGKLDSIMTECGGVLNAALLNCGMVDELNFFIVPRIFGAFEKDNFVNVDNGGIEQGVLSDFVLSEMKSLSGDVFLRYLNKK